MRDSTSAVQSDYAALLVSGSKGWRERAAPAGNGGFYFLGCAHSVPASHYEDPASPNVKQGGERPNSPRTQE